MDRLHQRCASTINCRAVYSFLQSLVAPQQRICPNTIILVWRGLASIVEEGRMITDNPN